MVTPQMTRYSSFVMGVVRTSNVPGRLGAPLRATVLWVVVGCGGTVAAESIPEAGAPDASAACPSAVGATVSLDLLRGGVPICAAGEAHPNVCCAAGPDRPTTCTEDPSSPFRPCSCDAFTFPDPRTCCSLASGGDCTDAGDTVTSGTCQNACGPGAWSVDEEPDSSSAELGACTDAPDTLLDGGLPVPAPGCVLCCFGQGECAVNASGCGSEGSPDSGLGGGGCGPSAFGCGPCPSGWQRAQGIPDLCCLPDAGASPTCFSQAAVIHTNP